MNWGGGRGSLWGFRCHHTPLMLCCDFPHLPGATPPLHQHIPGELAPENNTWDSWKWEMGICPPPGPPPQYTNTESPHFLPQGQLQARPSAGLFGGPISILRFLFPYTSCPEIVLFLQALAPSPRLLSPQPRLPGVSLESASVWGKSRETWSHFPGVFHSPSLSVQGMS